MIDAVGAKKDRFRMKPHYPCAEAGRWKHARI